MLGLTRNFLPQFLVDALPVLLAADCGSVL